MDPCGPRVLEPGAVSREVLENEISIQGKDEVSNRPGNGVFSCARVQAKTYVHSPAML